MYEEKDGRKKRGYHGQGGYRYKIAIRTETVITYFATDGSRFTDKEEAEQHQWRIEVKEEIHEHLCSSQCKVGATISEEVVGKLIEMGVI